MQYLDDKNILVILNENKNSLQYYDLSSKKMVRKYQFDREGIEGVGNLKGFFIADSTLYLLNTYKYQLFEFDTTGKKQRKYNLINGPISEKTALPFMETRRPCFKIGNKLYISCRLDADGTKVNFSDSPGMMELNLADGNYQYLVPGPKEYDGKQGVTNLSMQFFAHTYQAENKKIVVSYRFSEYLYVYDMNTKREVRYPAKTKHFKQVNQMTNASASDGDHLTFYRENACYSSVVYDKYRKVYYRFVEMPSKKALEMKSIFVFEYRNLAVIILDENFNQVGETAILPAFHDQHCFFITSDGFYLRKFTDNEDEMFFSRFELVKR